MFSFKNVFIHLLDLADSKGVAAFGKAFAEKEEKLDVLVWYMTEHLMQR